ncbi:unnamed protein product (macronuclear) [Paramecium tetraurelia]|uniref:Response regulatory domain-containing protein n=1 Tax=Paramecium tetraurelia TaxID=5888 RepID=A0CLK2_PARTE|nr:uncharacterized protein GSPATT00008218001 [Paramecium tetraurelia]CAK71669.1 unnamed protein product [Paramecium tetraurelia]|eukprot:XP_001439066.1 hypothetical protein (macronuclear) [Paramecium tetraurelia strain d4-2]
MILEKIWPAFITLVKIYAIIGLVYIIIYNSLYFQSFNRQLTTYYFYICFVGVLLLVYVVRNIIAHLKEQHRLTLINLTFILIETSFQLFLTEIFLSNESDGKILTICQMFINLLLILGIVRTIKLRIVLLLKFYIYFAIRNITFHFKSLHSLNIIIFIIMILYFWDQQLISLSKVSQFADQTLRSIPSAVCVLDSYSKDVLFTNSFTKKMIHQLNNGGLTGTKSLNVFQNQNLPSQESFITFSLNEIIQFFQGLYLNQTQLQEQFNVESQQKFEELKEINYLNQINLNQALDIINNVDCLSNGNIYQLQCQYENNQTSEYPVMIEVRIKTRLQYGMNKNAILLNFYDISPNFKSSYYKNLNRFKSQVIRSISHELRTRLNVIQGFLEVIQYKSQLFDKETNKLIRAAFNNCRIQNLIINSIIDYNLIREQKLVTKIQKCKLIQVVQETIDLFQEEADLKDVKIIFFKLINQTQYEMLDYEKFQSILIHIISNSLKFNRSNGQIFITLSKDSQDKHLQNSKEYEKKLIQPSNPSQLFKSSLDINESSFHFPLRKNTNFRQYINPSSQFSNNNQQTNTNNYDYYLLEIKDNGIGINQQKLEAIQNLLKNEEEFFEEQNSDAASGIMLGLRASNTLIKFLGGKEEENYITIDSIVNQGTTVCIHLKCRIAQLTEFMASDLYNKEGSQIQVEGEVAEFDTFSHKYNAWTDPEISSRTNIFHKVKRSPQLNLNFQNSSISNNVKKGSNQLYSGGTSSIHRNSGGSRILFQSAPCNCDQKIVIVDDEPYNLLVLESLLKQLGFQSIKADNGQQCVDLIEKSISQFEDHKCQGYKAIIMDYQMPIMNGQEATKQLQFLFREQPKFQIPIFGLTGFSGEDDLINLLSAGMKEVYIKPITLKNLEEIISSIQLIENKETSHFSSKQLHCLELDYDDEEKFVNE